MTSQITRFAGLQGTLTVPGDKSISHRALMFSALANGTSRITGLLPSADVLSTYRILTQLGVTIHGDPNQPGTEIVVASKGHHWHEPDDILDCGNSGTTTRLMTGLLAGQGFSCVLTGDASIRRRPMGRVLEPLRQMGAHLHGRHGDKLAPIHINRPRPDSGKLAGISYTMPVASAQVKSAILLAGLLATSPTTVIEPLATRDHTERMLAGLGASLTVDGPRITVHPLAEGQFLTPCNWVVPGDPSSAAFWIVAALLTPGSALTLQNVGLNPSRTGLIQALQSVGGAITITNQRQVGGEPVGDLLVEASDLKGDITLTAEDIPALVDEVPILTIAGLFLDGTLTISGAEELRKKESDRLQAMADELAKVGVWMALKEDGFTLQGDPALTLDEPSTPLASWHDHRIAMALTILNGVVNARQGKGFLLNWPLTGADCVNISYPTFFDHIAQIGGTLNHGQK
jgi:3-phosphoshikimate 1-carboxyvinyltransferase